MKAWVGGCLFTSFVWLYACVGDDPVPSSGPRDAGDGPNDASVIDGATLDAAPVPPGLTVTATPRVFVPANVATDVVVTIVRTGFDGPVKIEISNLPEGITADSAPTIAVGETTATLRLSTSSRSQRFSRAKLTATFEGANPLTVSTDVEVILRGKSGDTDTTFGEEGVVDLSSSGFGESLHDVVTDSEGRLYLLLPDLGNDKKCRVFRTTPNGAIDASGWGTNGIVELGRPGNGPIVCGRIALQADGKVLVGGSDALDGNESAGWVARVVGTATNGTFLDASYGDAGFVLTGGATVLGVAVDTQQRALVHGTSASNRYLVRVSTTGTLDTTFAVTNQDVLGTLAGTLLPTANGAIYGLRNGGSDLFRLKDDGALDTTLDNDGFLPVPTPSGGFDTELDALRVDGQGRIVGVGQAAFDDGAKMGGVVVRIAGDQRDATFGPLGDGVASVTGPNDIRYLHAVIDETDGILAASNEKVSDTDTRVVLTRFVDGAVDTSFSPGGLRAAPTVPGVADVQGLVLQEQRVLVLSFVQTADKRHPILARLWR